LERIPCLHQELRRSENPRYCMMMPDYDPDGLAAESVVVMDRDPLVLSETVMRWAPAPAEVKTSVNGRIAAVSLPLKSTAPI
jgi:hypothetical protein